MVAAHLTAPMMDFISLICSDEDRRNLYDLSVFLGDKTKRL